MGVIVTAHLLDGLPDPRKPAYSQAHTGIDKRLTRQLKAYRIKDPPILQEKSTPLRIVHSIVAAAVTSSNTRAHHIADLVGVLIFYATPSNSFAIKMRIYICHVSDIQKPHVLILESLYPIILSAITPPAQSECASTMSGSIPLSFRLRVFAR